MEVAIVVRNCGGESRVARWSICSHWVIKLINKNRPIEYFFAKILGSVAWATFWVT